MSYIVFFGISLFNQYFAFYQTMQRSAPTLICPCECKGEIGFAGSEDFIKRTFQETFAVTEPIVSIDKALYPGFASHLGLCLTGLRYSQVIIAKVCRHMRLVVPGEKRLGFSYIGPFRKSYPPPCIILRYRMKLRQLIRQYSGFGSFLF